MTGKSKNFPLPLAAVVDPAAKKVAAGSMTATMKIATPQTATRNAARDLLQQSQQPKSQQLKPAFPLAAPRTTPAKSYQGVNERERQSVPSSDVERANPLVSEAVRQAMVARIARQGVKDTVVLAAMQAVQRHLFMDSALATQAYIDASLPIGHHQTISQPYIVARMIEVLRNGNPLNRVLEIGTGCGYQAAVLSCLAEQVYSIERIKPLHELAKTNLRPMRIANIRLHYGDGMLGLPQAAPFDGIILAAAGLEVPRALLEQMSIGGRLVAPVGERQQVLQLIERVSKFEWTSATLEDCHFVPLRAGTV
jgi:protein-L-isoaspartate(D-aspartate) O-methyltransferase